LNSCFWCYALRWRYVMLSLSVSTPEKFAWPRWESNPRPLNILTFFSSTMHFAIKVWIKKFTHQKQQYSLFTLCSAITSCIQALQCVPKTRCLRALKKLCNLTNTNVFCSKSILFDIFLSKLFGKWGLFYFYFVTVVLNLFHWGFFGERCFLRQNLNHCMFVEKVQ
jgi:hypothetical protein